jgi:hypothetical protein
MLLSAGAALPGHPQHAARLVKRITGSRCCFSLGGYGAGRLRDQSASLSVTLHPKIRYRRQSAPIFRCKFQKNEREQHVRESFCHRPDDGMDGLSGKAKRHQHLRRVRQAVLYQTPCRPTFEACAGERCRVPTFLWRLPRIAAYYANLRDCTLPSERGVRCGRPPTDGW